MIRTALCYLAVVVATLAGCTTSQPDDAAARASPTVAPDARAGALWAHRTAYLGDNSKVIALVDDAGFGPRGTYALSLLTTRTPFGLTVTMTDPAKPFDATDFSAPATLLLGTVGNLQSVHVTWQRQTWTLTALEATATLGRDVKTLGRDRAALDGYLRDLRD